MSVTRTDATKLREVDDACLLVVGGPTHMRRMTRVPASRQLKRHGFGVAGKPEGFIVTGSQGPLRQGELDRARAWGATLAPHAGVPARSSWKGSSLMGCRPVQCSRPLHADPAATLSRWPGPGGGRVRGETAGHRDDPVDIFGHSDRGLCLARVIGLPGECYNPLVDRDRDQGWIEQQ